MPPRANANINARSQELTKNLIHTRHLLENNFKSIKRRECEFRKQKLVNFEEELKATARMARPAAGLEDSGRKNGEQSRSSSTGPLQSRSSASSTAKPALSRSFSSPEGWPHAFPPQFPTSWGGHGVMPKPSGNPAASPLAVSRACADVPAVMHPPPHPGALSMKPSRTRSLAAFATSHTAATLTPQIAMSAPSSPAASPVRRLERNLGNISPTREDDDIDFPSGNDETVTEKDPMISRLGYYMALLGPRYKTISREMIWEKAERGERTPAQRRLAKLGGIEAVGGGPDRNRPGGLAPGEQDDFDGKARSAWLAARQAERERRSRAVRNMTQ